MESTDFTPERSLKLISEMIEKSRRDFEENSGTPMIIWGSIVCAVSAVVWYLLYSTGNGMWNFLWFAIPLLGYPLAYMLVGRKEEKRAKSFLNDAIGYVWILFGAVSMLLAVLSCFVYTEAMPYLTQQIVLLLGFSTAVTGMLLKNYVIAAGGTVVAVGGCLLSVAVSAISLPLITGGASMIALLVPGIILNIKRK